jgi:DNA modification methylase
MTHKIINDDVINALKTLPDNSVDTIICDPPYNLSMAGWDAYDSDEAFGLWIREWGKEAYRVLRPGGTIAAFSAARTYQYLAYNLDQAGFKCRDMIEWVYWAGMPKGKNLKQCHEPIYLGYKEDKGNGLGSFTFNIDACRIPVKEKAKKKEPDTKVVSINNLSFDVKEVKERN